MSSNQVFVFLILCAIIFISEILVRNTWLKHLGTALLCILLGAVISNLGIIPTSSSAVNAVPVYDFIFSVLAPLSILWLLLQVNLKDIFNAGLPIIFLFIVGSFATAIGVIIGMKIIKGPESIGDLHHAIGGMLTGTYTGGSVNFNAVAIHYNVMEEAVLFGGTVVVDNIATALWMVLCIGLPKVLKRFWPKKEDHFQSSKGVDLGITEDTENMHPIDVATTLLIGFGSLYLAELGASWTSIPSIIILTILALVFAQFPIINRMKGPRMFGLFAVYLFLSVIGAYCDIGALGNIGALGISLLFLVTIIIIVHAFIIFLVARIFKLDPEMTSVASQANIGGSTSALALARSLGRKDLVLPAVLIGTLGNALGTFLGFWVASILV